MAVRIDDTQPIPRVRHRKPNARRGVAWKRLALWALAIVAGGVAVALTVFAVASVGYMAWILAVTA